MSLSSRLWRLARHQGDRLKVASAEWKAALEDERLQSTERAQAERVAWQSPLSVSLSMPLRGRPLSPNLFFPPSEAYIWGSFLWPY